MSDEDYQPTGSGDTDTSVSEVELDPESPLRNIISEADSLHPSQRAGRARFSLNSDINDEEQECNEDNDTEDSGGSVLDVETAWQARRARTETVIKTVIIDGIEVEEEKSLRCARLRPFRDTVDKLVDHYYTARILCEMKAVKNEANEVLDPAIPLVGSMSASDISVGTPEVVISTNESLKSRGIRLPGRDDESLAPIFTPARTVADSEVISTRSQVVHEHQVPMLPAQQTKEEFNVARNSIELLSTVLSSSPQQDALQAVDNSGEPRRPKTHWDHVLDEMVWLSKEFKLVRKWKLAQAKKLARRASKGMMDQAARGEKKDGS